MLIRRFCGLNNAIVTSQTIHCSGIPHRELVLDRRLVTMPKSSHELQGA